MTVSDDTHVFKLSPGRENAAAGDLNAPGTSQRSRPSSLSDISDVSEPTGANECEISNTVSTLEQLKVVCVVQVLTCMIKQRGPDVQSKRLFFLTIAAPRDRPIREPEKAGSEHEDSSSV